MLTDPCELQKATVARNKVHRGERDPTEVMISLPEFYLQRLGEMFGECFSEILVLPQFVYLS